MGNRDDEGQFTEEYDDEEFLSAIDSLPVASTQNIAEEVGCSYDLAYRRLNSLQEAGRIDCKEVGGSFIWLTE